MNGVIALGHSSGEVTMWTPNMGSTPVVKLLAHPSAPVTGLAISRNGTYMATTGKDSRLKIWDIRSAYKCLYDYFTPAPATCVDWSDTGLVACGFGGEIQVWKNSAIEKQKMPYMKHKLRNGD
jgi:U3 small nucleolar RNA-associated protein 7